MAMVVLWGLAVVWLFTSALALGLCRMAADVPELWPRSTARALAAARTATAGAQPPRSG